MWGIYIQIQEQLLRKVSPVGNGVHVFMPKGYATSIL